ncbi:hypothetical protein Cni_G16803 [Canna indica]|uniref:Transposase MuDR plant domain-containing protein n=1 Tax=Canna indica TaxID=4628 RepID=A0AAQ3KLK7_9LILI|nr:hypothetical protein Cni_G16803 [Canna indica]
MYENSNDYLQSDDEDESDLNNDEHIDFTPNEELIHFTTDDLREEMDYGLEQTKYKERVEDTQSPEEDETIKTDPNIFDNDETQLTELYLHQVFPNREEFIRALKTFCIKRNFELRHLKSKKIYIKVRCVNDDCPWTLSASGLDMFTVENFVNNYTCTISRLNWDHMKCSAKFIVNQIKDQLVGNQKYTPAMIITEIQKSFGVRISYKKAYNALHIALVYVQDHPSYLRELRIHDHVPKLSCYVVMQLIIFDGFSGRLEHPCVGLDSIYDLSYVLMPPT